VQFSVLPLFNSGFPGRWALAQHTADKHVSDGADLSELLSALAIEDNARPEASIGIRRPDLLDIFREALLSENTSIVLACFNDVSFQQAVTEEGLSMLHFACAFDSRCVALTLLDAGAPIDFKCTKRCNIDTDSTVSLGVEIGDTPLHVTARLGHETITKLLVDRGANVNAENHGKDIPLYIASSLGHQTVARILLEAQANAEALTISDETEETPIKTSILRLMGKLKAPSTSQEMGAEIRKLREKLEVRRRARLRRTVSTLTNAIQAQGFYPAQQNQLEQQKRHATMLQQKEHIVNARAHASNFPPNSSSPQPPLAVLDGSFVAPQPGAPFPPQPAGTPQQAVARPIIRTPEMLRNLPPNVIEKMKTLPPEQLRNFLEKFERHQAAQRQQQAQAQAQAQEAEALARVTQAPQPSSSPNIPIQNPQDGEPAMMAQHASPLMQRPGGGAQVPNTQMTLKPEQLAILDTKEVEPQLLGPLSSQIPQQCKTWGEMKQWAQQNNLPQIQENIRKLQLRWVYHQKVQAYQALKNRGLTVGIGAPNKPGESSLLASLPPQAQQQAINLTDQQIQHMYMLNSNSQLNPQQQHIMRAAIEQMQLRHQRQRREALVGVEAGKDSPGGTGISFM